jgi:hypothetical protein
MFVGESDNYTPPAQCRTYVNFMKSRAADVTLSSYSYSYNGYDAEAVLVQSSGVEHYARCDALTLSPRFEELPKSDYGKILEREIRTQLIEPRPM